MRTPFALLLCLLLSGLAAPVVYADALAPPDDVEQETAATGSLENDSPVAGQSVDPPARPSWSLGVVAILAMSVLIFVYMRRQHTLPDASSVDAKA